MAGLSLAANRWKEIWLFLSIYFAYEDGESGEADGSTQLFAAVRM